MIAPEESYAIVNRFYEEVVNGRNLDLVDALVRTDFVEHYSPPGRPQGLHGLVQFLQMLATAFPDLQGTVEDMMQSGDKVIARLTIRGTHNGPFFGIPATGKQVAWPAIHILRLEGGKIAERWALADIAGVLQQLGATPASGQTER